MNLWSFQTTTQAVLAERGHHRLKFVDAVKTAWRWTLFFRNGTTGVEFQWEDVLLVRLGRLEHGRLPTPPLHIESDTAFASHHLDLLLSLRAPGIQAPEPERATSEADQDRNLSIAMKATVDLMERYAGDILDGDFRIFDELDRIVRRNEARRLEELGLPPMS